MVTADVQVMLKSRNTGLLVAFARQDMPLDKKRAERQGGCTRISFMALILISASR